MKKIKRLVSILAITTLSLTLPFSSNISAKSKVATNRETTFRWLNDKKISKICDYDGTEISKTVSQKPDKDGNYEITLNVKGKPKEIKKPQDVLLIMDTSTSMYYDIKKLKESMDILVHKIIDNNPESKIAVLSFSDDVRENFSFNDKKQGESSDNYEKAIKDSYKDIPANGDTDIQGVLVQAKKIFDQEVKNDKAEKNIVFFTDGIANVYYNNRFEKGYKDYLKFVQFGGYPAEEEFLKSNLNYSDGWYEAKADFEKYNNIDNLYEKSGKKIAEKYESIEEVYDAIINENKNIRFYSVGLIDNIKPKSDKPIAINLLGKINNKGFYEINADDNKNESLTKIYEDISNDIILDKDMAKGLMITDEVPNNFEIVKDKTYNSKNSEIITQVDNKKIYVDASIEGNKISWNRGEEVIDSTDGIQFKFKIRPKNPYWGSGLTAKHVLKKIKTNEVATITYTKPSDNKKITGKFNIPKVAIPYKKGSISVSKNIINLEGKSINSDNKDFIICLDGGDKGKCNIKVKANGKAEIMNFYMKDKNTDTSNNKDTSLNYLIAGEYTVKELDSLNCETKSIKINGENVSLNGAKFTVDKDNQNIKIEITNIEKDKTNYNDKDGKENNFGKLSLPAIKN